MKISEKQYKEILKNDYKKGRIFAINYIRENINNDFDDTLGKLIDICERCSDLYNISMYEFVCDNCEELYRTAYFGLLDYLGISEEQYCDDFENIEFWEE